MPRFVLASGSPRRRALLASLIPEFDVVTTNVDESTSPGEAPMPAARRLALAKAEAVSAQMPDRWVIGGDTIVALRETGGWRLLAKPTDPTDACAMLTRLSDREHVVTTGIAILGPSGRHVGAAITRVRFRQLSPEEIATYVATGEPMDKAGAYAVQGGAGRFVRWTLGSLTNTIGLPLEMLRSMMALIDPDKRT